MGHTSSGRMFHRNVGPGTPVNGTVLFLVEKVFLAIPLPRPRPLPATSLTGDQEQERAGRPPCLPPLARALPRLVDLAGRIILAGI